MQLRNTARSKISFFKKFQFYYLENNKKQFFILNHMKSAYELAMERMGGDDDKPLTDEQKEKIAEIDTKYKAKIAERKIFLEKSVDDAIAKDDQTGAEEARKILAQEISSLEEKAESEKDKIRNS